MSSELSCTDDAGSADFGSFDTGSGSINFSDSEGDAVADLLGGGTPPRSTAALSRGAVGAPQSVPPGVSAPNAPAGLPTIKSPERATRVGDGATLRVESVVRSQQVEDVGSSRAMDDSRLSESSGDGGPSAEGTGREGAVGGNSGGSVDDLSDIDDVELVEDADLGNESDSSSAADDDLDLSPSRSWRSDGPGASPAAFSPSKSASGSFNSGFALGQRVARQEPPVEVAPVEPFSAASGSSSELGDSVEASGSLDSSDAEVAGVSGAIDVAEGSSGLSSSEEEAGSAPVGLREGSTEAGEGHRSDREQEDLPDVGSLQHLDAREHAVGPVSEAAAQRGGSGDRHDNGADGPSPPLSEASSGSSPVGGTGAIDVAEGSSQLSSSEVQSRSASIELRAESIEAGEARNGDQQQENAPYVDEVDDADAEQPASPPHGLRNLGSGVKEATAAPALTETETFVVFEMSPSAVAESGGSDDALYGGLTEPSSSDAPPGADVVEELREESDDRGVQPAGDREHTAEPAIEPAAQRESNYDGDDDAGGGLSTPLTASGGSAPVGVAGGPDVADDSSPLSSSGVESRSASIEAERSGDQLPAHAPDAGEARDVDVEGSASPPDGLKNRDSGATEDAAAPALTETETFVVFEMSPSAAAESDDGDDDATPPISDTASEGVRVEDASLGGRDGGGVPPVAPGPSGAREDVVDAVNEVEPQRRGRADYDAHQLRESVPNVSDASSDDAEGNETARVEHVSRHTAEGARQGIAFRQSTTPVAPEEAGEERQHFSASAAASTLRALDAADSSAADAWRRVSELEAKLAAQQEESLGHRSMIARLEESNSMLRRQLRAAESDAAQLSRKVGLLKEALEQKEVTKLADSALERETELLRRRIGVLEAQVDARDVRIRALAGLGGDEEREFGRAPAAHMAAADAAAPEAPVNREASPLRVSGEFDVQALRVRNGLLEQEVDALRRSKQLLETEAASKDVEVRRLTRELRLQVTHSAATGERFAESAASGLPSDFAAADADGLGPFGSADVFASTFAQRVAMADRSMFGARHKRPRSLWEDTEASSSAYANDEKRGGADTAPRASPVRHPEDAETAAATEPRDSLPSTGLTRPADSVVGINPRFSVRREGPAAHPGSSAREVASAWLREAAGGFVADGEALSGAPPPTTTAVTSPTGSKSPSRRRRGSPTRRRDRGGSPVGAQRRGDRSPVRTRDGSSPTKTRARARGSGSPTTRASRPGSTDSPASTAIVVSPTGPRHVVATESGPRVADMSLPVSEQRYDPGSRITGGGRHDGAGGGYVARTVDTGNRTAKTRDGTRANARAVEHLAAARLAYTGLAVGDNAKRSPRARQRGGSRPQSAGARAGAARPGQSSPTRRGAASPRRQRASGAGAYAASLGLHDDASTSRSPDSRGSPSSPGKQRATRNMTRRTASARSPGLRSSWVV